MNFQNIPRSDKVVKRAFVPKLDALMYFDYAQIELRLLAFYMAQLGDTSMADVIIAGEDLHTQSAMGALQLTRPPTDEERQVGKTLNFSIVYGGGTPTLMRQLGITYNEAREILDAYHQRWPGIRMVQNSINSRLQERGYITTLFGRHLHPDSDHKALNALIQGCAADLMKASLVKVHGWLTDFQKESHLVSVIHDELVLDATLAELDDMARGIPILMRDERIHSVVPIDTDCEVTFTTWADKAPYEERRAVA